MTWLKRYLILCTVALAGCSTWAIDVKTPYSQVTLNVSKSLYDGFQDVVRGFAEATDKYSRGQMSQAAFVDISKKYDRILDILAIMAGKKVEKGVATGEAELANTMDEFKVVARANGIGP